MFRSNIASVIISSSHHARVSPSRTCTVISDVLEIEAQHSVMLQAKFETSKQLNNRTDKIASRMSQNLQSITTFHKQLSNDYYNKEQEQTVKSDNNLQLISNTDNQLWPSHKTIPENTKEEGQWYYDRNYLDYNPEDSRIESASRLVHELPNDLNDTVTHISQITNDSILHSVAVKLGFGIGKKTLLLFIT
uniref:Uncharacterized protein n=1 Tax=Wuchereria bancrofti TaxID=6293 RepID=A0A1I8EH47_WUCBA